MLKGKIALVTGGSRGIGRAVAERLARDGADIAIFYAGNQAAAEEAKEAVKALGVRCAAFQCDVSDGAQVACGFGTVYEGLERVGVSGNDAVLVTGLGPVGLATAMLARAMGAQKILGIDVLPERLELARSLSLFDEVLPAGADNVAAVRARTGGHGVERAFDCSAHGDARLTCIQAARKWGRIVFMGEGGTVGFQPSPDIIHDQKSIHGSWVTSLWKMEELVERLVRWGIHPDRLVTHRFPLEKASEAYALMASGRCGKVAVVFDEELR